MFGPGQGHNIMMFFDFFRRHPDEYEVTHLYIGKDFHYDFETFRPVKIHKLGLNFFRSVRLVYRHVRGDYDLIWIHLWSWVLALLPIYLFRKRSILLNYNIWNESTARQILKKNPKGWLLRKFLKSCDFVQCNWWGTHELMQKIEGANAEFLPWGMTYENYDETTVQELHPFTQSFLQALPADKKTFFFPKSINPNSRHDLVIESVNLLVKEGIENFIVYFWIANRVHEKTLKRINELLDQYDLHHLIKVVEHPFIPTYDIKQIWKKVDCGLQIIEFDQLSTSLMEPLNECRPVIVSDKRPYRLFEEKYQVDLQLVENEPRAIADRMKMILDGKIPSPEALKSRKEVIVNNFNFEENIPRFIDYFLERRNGR